GLLGGVHLGHDGVVRAALGRRGVGPAGAGRGGTHRAQCVGFPDHRAMSSFDELYAAHYGELTVQLYAYFGDRQEAQDVVQEAFCRAYGRWRTVSTYDDPVAWVRRVAWNLAVSRWRRSRTALSFLRRHRPADTHLDGPGPDHVALVAALATLAPQQRRAVVLH